MNTVEQVWALEWTDTKSFETSICEVEGDVCYEVFREKASAESAVRILNEDAERNGWNSSYAVVPLPSHLTPYFGELQSHDEHRCYCDNMGEG